MYPYHIWKHPSGSITAIRDGWSWEAFFLNFAWAIYRGSWVLGLVVILASMALLDILGTEDIALQIFNYFVLATMVVFGIFGNQLRKANLKSNGYKLETSIVGHNARIAIARFKRLSI